MLERLPADAASALPDADPDLAAYLEAMQAIDPDDLSRPHALAYWLNLYNAAALRLAARTQAAGRPSVMLMPGAFHEPVVTVVEEMLSLDAIEHGKVRRFGDPRVHAGLVCGSVSCPTLRRRPYDNGVDDQLEEQMRRFLAGGAVVIDKDEARVTMSQIFSWFGSDFARPHRMPTLLPARRTTVLASLAPWLDSETADWISGSEPGIGYERYDWALSCSVA